MEGFSRDLLSGIGKGDAPAPPPEQLLEEVELSLGLSLGGRFGIDRTRGEKLPRSSSVDAMLKAPVEQVPAPPVLLRPSSLLVHQAEPSEAGRIQGLAAGGCGSSREGGGLGVEHAARLPAPAMQGTAEESSSSSSVLLVPTSVTAAASPLLPSSSAPRTAAAMGGVERRMMQQMPGVFTEGLPNGNRVDGFLYKYRKAEDVRIVCICHGSFLSPSEFVEHAGAGKVDNPLRHIVVSPTPTLW